MRRDAPLAGLDTGETDAAVLRGDEPAGVRSRVLFHEERVAAVARSSPWPGAGSWPGRNWPLCRWWSTR
ncbi:hypothetical protein ACFQ2B_19990 [Streptomyces stramineus]